MRELPGRPFPLTEAAVGQILDMMADGEIRFSSLTRWQQEDTMASAQYQLRHPQLAQPVPSAVAAEAMPCCFCGLPVVVHTATGSDRDRVNHANVGRQFWRCPRRRNDQCHALRMPARVSVLLAR